MRRGKMRISSDFIRVKKNGKDVVSAGTVGFDPTTKTGHIRVVVMALGYLKIEPGVYSIAFTQPLISGGRKYRVLDIEIIPAQISGNLEADFSIISAR
jgi:hypothetical protein